MTIPYRGTTGRATYFITASTFCKMPLLQSERMANLFCEKLFAYRAQGKLLLHAFVAMPDHIHLLLTVIEGSTLERSIQLIKGGFSREAGKLIPLSHPFWQKSFFDRRVRDLPEFDKFKDYIHLNPVRARLCTMASEYPYSSCNPRYVMDSLPQWLKPQTSEPRECTAEAVLHPWDSTILNSKS
jgi:putative transposase